MTVDGEIILCLHLQTTLVTDLIILVKHWENFTPFPNFNSDHPIFVIIYKSRSGPKNILYTPKCFFQSVGILGVVDVPIWGFVDGLSAKPRTLKKGFLAVYWLYCPDFEMQLFCY